MTLSSRQTVCFRPRPVGDRLRQLGRFQEADYIISGPLPRELFTRDLST